ncbi:MAG: rRNA pseudouridine synthase [Clostridia bacterium]|nr:rRNA pseudouridine synthase [Clostridia bacterium]
MAEKIRLQKYFTDCGILSRRRAEAEITAGNVRVNGTLAHLGDKIDPEADVVEFEGRIVRPRPTTSHIYLMLNKPRGYVTTAKDEKGRPNVTQLTAGVGSRVYPVGRLDMDSEGLLLLTDDGEFTNRLTHPRHEIPKIYHVTVFPAPSPQQLHALSQPMEMDGYRLLPIGVHPLGAEVLELTLYEGRNRQIRKMCQTVGLRVRCLRRVAIGKLSLGSLPCGKWRHLTACEVAYLMPTAETKEKETDTITKTDP